jgi:hypothetical protein
MDLSSNERIGRPEHFTAIHAIRKIVSSDRNKLRQFPHRIFQSLDINAHTISNPLAVKVTEVPALA